MERSKDLGIIARNLEEKKKIWVREEQKHLRGLTLQKRKKIA